MSLIIVLAVIVVFAIMVIAIYNRLVALRQTCRQGAADIDAQLRQNIADFDFNAYIAAVSTFVNNDLSAFYFDIRKDVLYCDAPSSLRRRACRTGRRGSARRGGWHGRSGFHRG